MGTIRTTSKRWGKDKIRAQNRGLLLRLDLELLRTAPPRPPPPGLEIDAPQPTQAETGEEGAGGGGGAGEEHFRSMSGGGIHSERGGSREILGAVRIWGALRSVRRR